MTARPTLLLVDDEPLVRDHLRELVEAQGDFAVAGECRNGSEALEAVRTLRPDLLLLDVEMPGMTGLDVVAALGNEAPRVVFVTAYDRYALSAFDLHAVDFVLKPVDEERLRRALRRANAEVRRGEINRLSRRLVTLLREMGADIEPAELPEPEDVVPAPTEEQPITRLSIRNRGRWTLVDVQDVDWIEAAHVYSKVHAGGRAYLLRQPLRRLEHSLPDIFCRIHRSTIVNAMRVREVRAISHGEYVVTLHDGTPLKVSRSYRDRLIALVNWRGQQGRTD